MTINGESYAWEGVAIKLPHGTLIDVADIEYSDERGINRIHGKGSKTRGYTRGKAKGSGKVTLQRTEYERLVKSFPKGIYSGKPFQITVSYAAEGQTTVTDELQDCLFSKRKFGIKQDDDSANVELEFEILGDVAAGGKSPFPDSK